MSGILSSESAEKFIKSCGNAFRIKYESKNKEGNYYKNRVREIDLIISLYEGLGISPRNILGLGQIGGGGNDWFVKLEKSVQIDKYHGNFFNYKDGEESRTMKISDIADGDELVTMKFSIRYLPIDFDLKLVEDYFARLNFSNITAARYKINQNESFLKKHNCNVAIETNQIFVSAKLKKKDKCQIISGNRNLFGFKPRFDILDGKKRCRLCNSEGHINSECPNTKKFCTRCNQRGHIVTECNIAFMLKKGLYSQLDDFGFGDEDELKFNAFSQEELKEKKVVWQATKDKNEKKNKLIENITFAHSSGGASFQNGVEKENNNKQNLVSESEIEYGEPSRHHSHQSRVSSDEESDGGEPLIKQQQPTSEPTDLLVNDGFCKKKSKKKKSKLIPVSVIDAQLALEKQGNSIKRSVNDISNNSAASPENKNKKSNLSDLEYAKIDELFNLAFEKYKITEIADKKEMREIFNNDYDFIGFDESQISLQIEKTVFEYLNNFSVSMF